ncbi:MAG: Ig-like domain-containing protein [Myxococcales bacterium]|nr:Ig-like domain-containing protein [Myxococcales bacterium]
MQKHLWALALVMACGDSSATPEEPSAATDAGPRPAQADNDAGPAAPSDASATDATAAPSYPAPGAWPKNKGPGGPSEAFTADKLYEKCAYLDGASGDTFDHHNLVTMLDGYLVMPWAPEWGGGGISFFDVSKPCAPTRVGAGESGEMRESHSIGFSHRGGRYAVVDGIGGTLVATKGGIQFWDVSDVTAPKAIKLMELPGFLYPDAYARVTLSVFWQDPYVFVGGADNGLFVVDATDPKNPTLVNQTKFTPTMRVGQVQAIGNLLVVTTAESPRTVLLDISNPKAPQPIAGGDFLAREAADGAPREAYFSNFANGYVFYARKEAAGGLIVYDVRNPAAPLFAGVKPSDGNGGYVFVKDNLAFVGESSFAAIYDVSNLSAITEVKRLTLTGDLDTMTPIGNVVVLSVDDKADPNKGSAIAPYQTDVDTKAPTVTWAWPSDGAKGLPRTSRLGFTTSEPVDSASAWEGSVRLMKVTATGKERVPGTVSAQENIVNFSPLNQLDASSTYVLDVPVGGLADFNGNAITQPFSLTFTTGQ